MAQKVRKLFIRILNFFFTQRILLKIILTFDYFIIDKIINLLKIHIILFFSVTKLPIVLKGILTAEDALLSVKYGAAAIIVSNHGARQVDGVPATVCIKNYLHYQNIFLRVISFNKL